VCKIAVISSGFTSFIEVKVVKIFEETSLLKTEFLVLEYTFWLAIQTSVISLYEKYPFHNFCCENERRDKQKNK
jgi:hypothetical protein